MNMEIRRARGFTLIELMVTVVIVGILASLAYPSYMNSVRQTRRADGKAALLDAAQRLERCFTRFHAYNAAGCDVAGDLNDADGLTSPEEWYVLRLAGTATTFTLIATPQNDQTKDVRCGNLTLTHQGVRGAADVAACW
jgi:type IV pilus assembly protein PilE